MMVFNTPRALLFALASALVANAAIYVTQPSAGSTCHGDQPCSISWLDDGQAPLLSSIGVTRVAVYTGDLQLVQTIQPVDVSSAHSLTFTPNPKAGPNSDSYYIAFIPVSDSTYRGYSPWFTLDNMSGSFGSPDPGATSSLPLPSTSGSGSPTGNQTTTAETTASQSGSASAISTSGTLTATTETSATSGASEATSSGSSTIRASSSGTGSGTSSGATSSGTTTRTSASSTASAFNAAAPNSVPATGIAWTLLAFLGATLL